MFNNIFLLIQKSTVFKPADNCGVLRARVFHVYKGSHGRLAYTGELIKCSAIEVLPENPVRKKTKSRGVVIRTVFRSLRRDGLVVIFKRNSCVLLKKRMTPRGNYLRGVVPIIIRRKKFLSSFAKKI
jgi:ribosomal protein L14